MASAQETTRQLERRCFWLKVENNKKDVYIDKLQHELKRKYEQANDLHKEKIAIQKERLRLQKQLAEENNSRSSFQEELVQEREQVSELRLIKLELENDIMDVRDELQEKERVLHECNATIRKQEEAISTYVDQLSRANQIEIDFQKLQVEDSTLREQNKTLMDEKTERDMKVYQLSTELHRKILENNTLIQEKTILENKLSDTKKNLDHKIQEKEGMLQDNKRTIEKQENAIKHMKDGMTLLRQENKTLRDEKSAYEVRIENITFEFNKVVSGNKVLVQKKTPLEDKLHRRLHLSENIKQQNPQTDDVEIDRPLELLMSAETLLKPEIAVDEVGGKKSAAAMRVAGREHSLENRTLKASLHVPPKPPPSYEDRVLIKGLNPFTTQDCLFNFIEAKTDFIPERIDYHADQEGVVIVSFQMGKEGLVFDKMEKVFGRSKLEGASLKVSRVPIPDCIIVSNLKPEVTRHTVEYYFENMRKSGGGPVKKVVMNDDDTCLVYFEDYTVIDEVLKRQHTLGNQSLDVKRYQECLGLPECVLAERKLRTPEDIIVQDVDISLIKFMKTSNKIQTVIKKQLELCHAKVLWPGDVKGDVILKCTITLATPECFRLVKIWNKKALKNFQDYLKLFAVHKVPVLQDIWQRVIDELKTVNVQNPDTVALYVDKKSGFITTVGNKHVADSLSKKVEEIAKKKCKYNVCPS